MLKSIVGVATAAAASDSSSQALTVSDTIIELDRKLNRAILNHDVSAAAALYDDDFLLTVSGGGVKRMPDMLADIGSPGVRLTVCETTDVAVRVRGGTAVLTGTLRQAGAVNGRPIDVKLHVTDTWVDVAGRWLLFAGHASPAK